MSTSGSGDPFHGDKRTDETVMISSENLSDLVAQAKSSPDAAAPASSQPVADGDTGPNKTLIMVAAIVAVVVVLAVLVFALG